MLEKIPTYILFEKEKGVIIDIMPPVFENEIEEHCAVYFEGVEVETLSESTFKLLYPEEYENEKRTFWIDYSVSVLMSLIGVDLAFAVNDFDSSIEGEFFVLAMDESESELRLWFSADCDPIISSMITLELSAYFAGIYEIDIMGLFFVSKNGHYFTQEKVYLPQLLEQIHKN